MRSRAIRAFVVLAAVLAGPASLPGQTAQLTIAPKDPVITAPTLCQKFSATFVNAKGITRNVPLLWSVTNPTGFTVDTTGQVCAQAAPAASASSMTGVIASVSGRSLRDSTTLTILPAPSVAVLAKPPRGDIVLRQRPGMVVEQPQTTATAPPATIARLQPGDVVQRYRPPGAAPTGVTVASYSPISAILSWQPAAGAAGYTVARATSAAGHYDVVTPSPVSGTSYTDTGLAPVTTYYWTVTANYAAYGPGTSAVASAATTPPKNPTDFKAKPGKVGELILSWSPSSDAAYYVLSGDGVASTQVNGTTYTLSNLPGGTRTLSLVAYYTSAGQSYADAVNPSKLWVAALPQNGAPWLSRHGAGSTAEADQYYTTISAKSGKATLAQWKAANGFPAQGLAGDEIRVEYFNAQDLNLGRDTHCRIRTQPVGSNPALIACYQNNSGPPPGTAGFPDADKALNDMVQGKPPFATVAMDQESNGNVNFYAYNETGALVPAVVLDNEGPKPMPNACTACHGGYYDANSHTMSKASFLPFDVFGFKFASAPSFTLADQQEGFRKVNLMVKYTRPNATNPNNPIVTFIDGMYGGAVEQPGVHASDNWYPSGWSAKPNVYDVFKRTCRTCHLASQGYDFMKYIDVINAKNIITIDVCSGKVMPHAEVPYRKFWTQTTVYLPGYWSDPSTFGITCP